MLVFWEYPPLPYDYPYDWFISDAKWKQDKVKVTNLKNLPKIQILECCKIILHRTHFLKFLEEMYKYEMDPASIVEDRRTRWN